MRKGKVWLLFMMILLFLCGAAICFQPYINGAVVDSTLKQEAQVTSISSLLLLFCTKLCKLLRVFWAVENT